MIMVRPRLGDATIWPSAARWRNLGQFLGQVLGASPWGESVKAVGGRNGNPWRLPA
jgi:hypothetical protein